jgi:hypothetical protein
VGNLRLKRRLRSAGGCSWAVMCATAATTFVAGASPANAALSTPVPLAPAVGANVESPPPFAWKPVGNADHYEFELAADAGFNSPVLGRGQDQFTTRSTRATLLKTVPNGRYWWRVRAVTAKGKVSAWSAGRSFTKQWTATANLASPPSGSSVSFPLNPIVLTWSPVAGAAQYLVSVASDPSLSSLVLRYANQDNPSGPPNVAATNAAVSAALAPGTYYWGVTPLDAEGNRGSPSRVFSFTWSWPSTTTPRITDLNPASEVFDPQFSWDPVPGAVRYEIEVNPSADFAPGSKVCCSGTTIATTLSPTTLLKDNVYYWRVRAFDADDNAGVWNNGPTFTKSFDKVAPAGPVAGTSIKGVRMRDNTSDPGVDIDSLTPGYQTQVPIVSWDPVPGASSYELQIADWTGTACSWATADYIKRMAVTWWTPLGSTAANPIVYPGLATDGFTQLGPGTYCLRVRARTDRVGSSEIYGDYTYLQGGGTASSAAVGPAFTWTGYPSGGSSACGGYLCAADYLQPEFGATRGTTPLFTWNKVNGANSYFVVISKDQNFSNIVDEAFTRVPAYAPRSTFRATTYPDETTSYYWAVLPSSAVDGSTAPPLDAILSSPSNFQKQSTPPTLLAPTPGSVFLGLPTFRWSPVAGARRYRLQVASDPTFSDPIDNLATNATSYSSATTYPADTVLYWRVRADDENLIGLTWSATGTFQKRLPAPALNGNVPTAGETLPVLAWQPIQGASTYDIAIDQPDGRTRQFSGFRAPVASFIKMTGTGVWHWRVRANFPKSFGSVPGPWSPSRVFTRTIGEPVGLHTDTSRDHLLLSWNPKFGIKSYRVEIAARPDFATKVETVATENSSYAPRLESLAYRGAATLFWRVAAVDADGNAGDFSRPQPMRLLPQLSVRVSGRLRVRRWTRLTVSVAAPGGDAVRGARVNLAGRGLRPQARTTNARGVTSFRLRPTRRGQIRVSASKPGYQPKTRILRVR